MRTTEAPFPCVVFGLADDEATKADYPHSFSLRYSVTLDGPNSVSTAMQVQNTGEAPLEFTGALHTYVKVGDATGVKFQGLQGVTYEDSAAERRACRRRRTSASPARPHLLPDAADAVRHR